jgi:hypothetical protein
MNATIACLPEKRGRRSAERRIQPLSAPRHQMLPPECASGAVPPPNSPAHAGEGGEGARLTALRGGACQSDRTLRLSRAALHAKERAPALPAPSIALKRSTPHPGRRPQGTMPEPGNGVTSPARRNRTRSINRPSPVTSLERTGIVPVT